MKIPPEERFSERVADYVRYRPRYPAALVPLLEARCGLAVGHTIADIGSGTGFLAELFLNHGNQVHAVEPNAAMRRAAEQRYGHLPTFISVDGTAEASGLAGASIDFIVAGQAFHWFDAGAARAEFTRILRPGGWIVLVWNERPAGEAGFQADYEALLQRHGTDYAAVDHRQVDDERIHGFFGRTVERAVLENAQVLDREGLAGRVRSCSYVPGIGDPGFEPMMAEVEGLFARYEKDGCVTMRYDTKMYFGQLHGREVPASIPRPARGIG